MHDTPWSSLYCEVEVFGLVTMDQAEPFQDSIRVWSGVAGFAKPAATQKLGLVHDTPWSRLLCEVEVFGLVTMDQAEPFQDSMRVWVTLLWALPTATQKLGLVHETPKSSLSRLPGLGLEAMDQTEPFQVSTSVWLILPLNWEPTATQKLGLVHETP